MANVEKSFPYPHEEEYRRKELEKEKREAEEEREGVALDTEDKEDILGFLKKEYEREKLDLVEDWCKKNKKKLKKKGKSYWKYQKPKQLISDFEKFGGWNDLEKKKRYKRKNRRIKRLQNLIIDFKDKETPELESTKLMAANFFGSKSEEIEQEIKKAKKKSKGRGVGKLRIKRLRKESKRDEAEKKMEKLEKEKEELFEMRRTLSEDILGRELIEASGDKKALKIEEERKKYVQEKVEEKIANKADLKEEKKLESYLKIAGFEFKTKSRDGRELIYEKGNKKLLVKRIKEEDGEKWKFTLEKTDSPGSYSCSDGSLDEELGKNEMLRKWLAKALRENEELDGIELKEAKNELDTKAEEELDKLRKEAYTAVLEEHNIKYDKDMELDKLKEKTKEILEKKVRKKLRKELEDSWAGSNEKEAEKLRKVEEKMMGKIEKSVEKAKGGIKESYMRMRKEVLAKVLPELKPYKEEFGEFKGKGVDLVPFVELLVEKGSPLEKLSGNKKKDLKVVSKFVRDELDIDVSPNDFEEWWVDNQETIKEAKKKKDKRKTKGGWLPVVDYMWARPVGSLLQVFVELIK